MNAPADVIDPVPLTDSPASADPPRRKRFLLPIAAVLSAAAVVTLILLQNRPAPAPAPRLLEPGASAPVATVPVPAALPGSLADPAAVAPLALSTSTAAAPAAPGAPAPALEIKTPASASVAQRFDKVDAALGGAQAALDKQSEQIEALQRSLAALAEKLAAPPKQAEAPAPGAKVDRADKPAKTSARPTRRVARAPAAAAGEVLSVDTWNGQPVVAIAAGGKLHFMRAGDNLGGVTLAGADAATQRASFRAQVEERSFVHVPGRKAIAAAGSKETAP